MALRPDALGHTLLLTDGKDEDESPADLRRAVEECEGAFQCHCRGVGTAWAVDELRRVGAQTIQFRLGGWADKRRDYHLTVDVEPAPIGSEMAACRLSVVGANRIYSSGLVRAVWTDDPELTARIDPDVAHYTGQADLAAAVQDGLEAKREGDLGTATLRLGRAAQPAAASGNTDLLSLLAKVVDVVDADTGTVSLRREVEVYDEMALDTRSTRTVPARANAAGTLS